MKIDLMEDYWVKNILEKKLRLKVMNIQLKKHVIMVVKKELTLAKVKELVSVKKKEMLK